MQQILIANSLSHGFVVFMTDTYGWSANVADAAIASDDVTAADLLSAAALAEKDNLVIDAYLVEVQLDDGVPIPVEYREHIRVFGPSVGIPSSERDAP